MTKINPAGTALIYSTYIGGSDDEGGLGIALDSNDRAYVTGYTRSYNFPEGHGGQELTAQGNFGSGYLDGAEDAFVLRLNADGSGLEYCDYLGGWSNERGQDIAVDAGGDLDGDGLDQPGRIPGVPLRLALFYSKISPSRLSSELAKIPLLLVTIPPDWYRSYARKMVVYRGPYILQSVREDNHLSNDSL